MGKPKICSDECPNAIYIGEGNFICDKLNDIVITDFTPFYDKCILEEEKKAKK